ncbi:class I SAM-dependent methyltransferase [Streptomyces sp. NPDC101062]|uniref:class I SAM-dependent methyltransferase n=1 Tax=unclassified Streptomyces TaxID=2593676 RepID=UPI002E77A6EE|nr:class I SAM-dependent methyltransferase [Streptomyces sp. JV176]MEE1797885.1 class I SAM-dependent methyltransferase [Streptomyces sp. JV176]
MTPAPAPRPTPHPTARPTPGPTTRALSFDAVADQYDEARPGYPPALFDAIEELAGRPLRGARVIDVGAGTGIATRLLRARGARVTAVEPGPGMAERLHRTQPAVPLLRGLGDALPLADGCADLITYAQAWHWTDPARSLPEALRVLRPGGALALWWNIADADVPWIAAQDLRIRRWADDSAHGAHSVSGRGGELPAELRPAERRVRWTRRVPLDTHLAHLGSHSVFRMRGEEATAAFLAAERAELLGLFPDGTVEEAYVVELTLTRRA